MYKKVSIDQRVKASKIVLGIRKAGKPRNELAKEIGISPTYVSFAMGAVKRTDCEGYQCPAWAIHKILEWAGAA